MKKIQKKNNLDLFSIPSASLDYYRYYRDLEDKLYQGNFSVPKKINLCEHPDCDEEGELYAEKNGVEVFACEEHADWALVESQARKPAKRPSNKQPIEVTILNQAKQLYNFGFQIDLISLSYYAYREIYNCLNSGKIYGRTIDVSDFQKDYSPFKNEEYIIWQLPFGNAVKVVLNRDQQEDFLLSINTYSNPYQYRFDIHKL